MKKINKILGYFGVLFLYNFYFCLSINAQIPSNNVVSCYPFSGNANDMSDNNHHGTVYGATLTTDRFGRPNNAYNFNGSTNYISLTPAPFLLPSFSYSVWAYVSAYPATGESNCMVSIGSYAGASGISVNNTYSIYNSNGWSFGSTFELGASGLYWWVQGYLPPLNTWFHLVLTRDANYFICYINGQLVNSQPTNGTTPYYGSGTPLAFIGRRCEMSLTQYFNGKIDDIHIYNRALTATEVNILYNGESNAVTITANPGTTINQGENITFTAAINGSITNPTYQWQVNGPIVGGNLSTFSTTSLNNGDSVRCLVFSSQSCEVPAYSNSLTITVTSLPSNDLVACYPFNGNVNDMSGNNHHGSVYGATLTTDRFGRPNNAYNFNGTTNYINLPPAPFLLPCFSYSVWAYATSYPSTGDEGSVISIGSYAGGGGISFSNANTTVRGWMFGSYYAPGNMYNWGQGIFPPLNTWFHLVLTRDGNYINFFINGQMVSSQPTNGTSPYYGSGTTLAHIGRRDQMPLNQFFNGKIDDIHIYNRALSATEVNNLYNGENNAVTITANPGTTINQGENITFTATINGNITDPTYQWQVNNIIVGGNLSTFSTTSLNNGDSVRCLVFPSQSCEVPTYSNSLTISVTTSNIDIKELNNIGLTLFPNPNDGKFTISFNSFIESTYKIEIIDALGKQVYKETINEFKGAYTKQINLAKYGKCIYTMSLSNGKIKLYKKIVVL